MKATETENKKYEKNGGKKTDKTPGKVWYLEINMKYVGILDYKSDG